MIRQIGVGGTNGLNVPKYSLIYILLSINLPDQQYVYATDKHTSVDDIQIDVS